MRNSTMGGMSGPVKGVCTALALLLATGCASTNSSHDAQSVLVGPLEGLPFEHHQTQVGSGSAANFYLATTQRPAPLLLFIQGSGCGSAFGRDERGRSYSTLMQDRLFLMAQGRFSVLVADKQGVAPGAVDQSGEADACTEEFRKTHTLENWTTTLSSAIDAARELEGVDADAPVRVMGFSEGAIAAARLASLRPDISHTAFLSGYGCILFDDISVLAQRSWREAQVGLTSEELEHGSAQVANAVLSGFLPALQKEPSADVLIEGQPATFWQSFGMACPAADLARFDGQVFVAVGLDDGSLVAEGAEEIAVRRLVAGRTTTMVRVVDGNHLLARPDDPRPDTGLVRMFGEVLHWMADQ